MVTGAVITDNATREQVRDWMVNYISVVLDIKPEDFPTAETFDTYGLDSVEGVVMAGMLEQEFGVAIEPGELVEHPSVDKFSQHLAGRIVAADGPATATA